MKTRMCIVMILSFLLLGVAGCGQKNPEAEQAATVAAESWLKILDAGEYERTWTEAASIFKSAMTEEGWVAMVKPIRDPLGEVESRELIRAVYSTSLPNAPEGEYVVIQYKTDYTNKKDAVETITPMLDTDGQWRVSGYFIK